MFDPPKPPPTPTFKEASILEGWDEFHKWACQNDAMWAHVSTGIQRGIYKERDGLRYLAANALSLALKWRGLALDMQSRSVQPILVVDPETL